MAYIYVRIMCSVFCFRDIHGRKLKFLMLLLLLLLLFLYTPFVQTRPDDGLGLVHWKHTPDSYDQWVDLAEAKVLVGYVDYQLHSMR